ncbi:MAG: tryptophan synthase subunit alpha [Phycisphaerales bacterium]
MSRIDRIFADLRTRSARGLMPFIVGGHPGPGRTARLIQALEQAGASVVEVGLPFSDPVADGPVVASAMDDALRAGSTPESVLREIGEARGELSIGIVCMVSASIVYRLGGAAGFAERAAAAGIDGFIFPDVSFEESGPYREAAAAVGASCSLLVAPSSSDERAAAIARGSSGFVYALARAGITGEREDLPVVESSVARLRASTALPIAVGFGISSAQQVRAVVRHADAAIVGSALVRRLTEAPDRAEQVAGDFTRELAAGLA